MVTFGELYPLCVGKQVTYPELISRSSCHGSRPPMPTTSLDASVLFS